ncbi:dual specificity protein phosphatase 18 [Engraulis encrasicolus]|uniref:dual specificity protein phosphatase 18 n=1 Tax=Engraulis encrasicolus TaxID=184585 RepID=UPI002FD355D1
MSVSQITPSLFLSGADAALNQALLTRKGITLIINVTLSHACPTYPGVECVRVPVPDLPSARLGDHFERVAARIHGNRGGGTLVHCAVGFSRSPTLVIAYLMKHKGLTLRQAHGQVQESRPGIRLNAGFWEQLLEYEKRLYGKNTVKVATTPLEPIASSKSPLLGSIRYMGGKGCLEHPPDTALSGETERKIWTTLDRRKRLRLRTWKNYI